MTQQEVGAAGTNPGGARAGYAPEAARGATCGRDGPAPSIDPGPRPARRTRPGLPATRVVNPEPGRSRCGKHDTHETRCCCCGCRARCRCGWPRAGSWCCCSRSRRAARAKLSGCPTGLAARGRIVGAAPGFRQKFWRRFAAHSGQGFSGPAFSAPVIGFSMGETRHTRNPT